jgi:hypothetical protein
LEAHWAGYQTRRQLSSKLLHGKTGYEGEYFLQSEKSAFFEPKRQRAQYGSPKSDEMRKKKTGFAKLKAETNTLITPVWLCCDLIQRICMIRGKKKYFLVKPHHIWLIEWTTMFYAVGGVFNFPKD